MEEWIENSNGNFVYVIDTDDVMTVFSKGGQWRGAYDDRFTDETFKTPEAAMAVMERAVLGDESGLLVKHRPQPTGWRQTKTGGFHCVRGGSSMSVKLAKSGKWYLVMDQVLLKGHWFHSAEAAMLDGDHRVLYGDFD